MAKNVGTFICNGDDGELYHPIRSKSDNRSCLEYFVQTGMLPWRQGNCDICKNKGKQEVCDKCTGMNPLFVVITIEEAKERLQQEKQNGK